MIILVLDLALSLGSHCVWYLLTNPSCVIAEDALPVHSVTFCPVISR